MPATPTRRIVRPAPDTGNDLPLEPPDDGPPDQAPTKRPRKAAPAPAQDAPAAQADLAPTVDPGAPQAATGGALAVLLDLARALVPREAPTDTVALHGELAGPFEPDAVDWKPQTLTRDKKKAMAVAYLKNRAIQDRLDTVCGPTAWQNTYRPGPGGGIVCGIAIRVVQPNGVAEWVTKWDGAENSQVEAVKGGLSDSMKRAAVQWGIGRYLYRLPAQWVPVDDRGRFERTPELPPAFRPRPTPEQRAAPTRKADEDRRNAEKAFHAAGNQWVRLVRNLVSYGKEWDAQRPRIIAAYAEQEGIDVSDASTNELTTEQLRELIDGLNRRVKGGQPPQRVYTESVSPSDAPAPAAAPAAAPAPEPAAGTDDEYPLTAEEREALEHGDEFAPVQDDTLPPWLQD